MHGRPSRGPLTVRPPRAQEGPHGDCRGSGLLRLQIQSCCWCRCAPDDLSSKAFSPCPRLHLNRRRSSAARSFSQRSSCCRTSSYVPNDTHAMGIVRSAEAPVMVPGRQVRGQGEERGERGGIIPWGSRGSLIHTGEVGSQGGGGNTNSIAVTEVGTACCCSGGEDSPQGGGGSSRA